MEHEGESPSILPSVIVVVVTVPNPARSGLQSPLCRRRACGRTFLSKKRLFLRTRGGIVQGHATFILLSGKQTPMPPSRRRRCNWPPLPKHGLPSSEAEPSYCDQLTGAALQVCSSMDIGTTGHGIERRPLQNAMLGCVSHPVGRSRAMRHLGSGVLNLAGRERAAARGSFARTWPRAHGLWRRGWAQIKARRC